ncbi:BnaC04g51280D [Brassica napus]|uniref:BnaC04g51280D protein n=3 Tax=Brassica TaxID=3705 RepID=A0A078GQN2_BRANA|nr:BnaC04g51280D [Brassica napus]VDD16544.1 unnamed protein product [Brassica oleracea]
MAQLCNSDLFETLMKRTQTHEPSSVEKIMEIDDHIGCAISGIIADALILVEHGRVETQVSVKRFLMLLTASLLIFRSIDYRMVIKPMKVESTTQAMCDLALRLSEGDEESMIRINHRMTSRYQHEGSRRWVMLRPFEQ